MTETLKVRIVDIIQETADTLLLTFSSPTGQELPEYSSGAHIDVHLPNNLIRQYSLWPAPDDRLTYKIAVKRVPDSRGGSVGVHELLKIGDEIKISHPRNSFQLVENGKTSILFAGGIGITPLLSMALHMKANGTPFYLHYFVQSMEQAAFVGLIERANLAPQTTYHVHLNPSEVSVAIEDIVTNSQRDSEIYLCGPAPFMEAARSIAAKCFAQDSIHMEFFAAKPPSLSAGDDDFEVHLAKSKQSYIVPSDKTIAEVLIENGIEIELSCEMGICGTCLTGVLEGEPQHEDQFLSDAEHACNDRMTICVSRCKGRSLTLDI